MPVADLNALYQRPAGTAKRPPLLPKGSGYLATVTAFDGGTNTNTGNSYVRWFFRFRDWDPAIPADMRDGINLDSYTGMYCDMYTTDKALFMLDDFIRQVGVDLPTDGSRKYEEVLPEVIGSNVLVEVDSYIPRGRSAEEAVNNVRRMIADPEGQS